MIDGVIWENVKSYKLDVIFYSSNITPLSVLQIPDYAVHNEYVQLYIYLQIPFYVAINQFLKENTT